HVPSRDTVLSTRFLVRSRRRSPRRRFPYTTLFRSGMVKLTPDQQAHFVRDHHGTFKPAAGAWGAGGSTLGQLSAVEEDVLGEARSEEHTSELQSLRHLVCRLLLEKRNRWRSPRGRR